MEEMAEWADMADEFGGGPTMGKKTKRTKAAKDKVREKGFRNCHEDWNNHSQTLCYSCFQAPKLKAAKKGVGTEAKRGSDKDAKKGADSVMKGTKKKGQQEMNSEDQITVVDSADITEEEVESEDVGEPETMKKVGKKRRERRL
jgi:hypothetical protein